MFYKYFSDKSKKNNGKIAREFYRIRSAISKELGCKGQLTVGMLNGYINYKEKMSIDEYYLKVKNHEIFDPTVSVQEKIGFEIKGLMKVKEPIEYIEFTDRKYSHTDRKTFLRTNAKSLQIGLVRYLEANSPEGSNSDFKQTGGGAKYDLLERDY